MKRSFNSVLVIIAIFGFACKTPASDVAKNAEAKPVFHPDSVRSIIEAKNEGWAKAITSNDSVFMVNHYTRDGKIFPPNSDAVVGRESIAKLISAYMKFGIKTYKDETRSLYGNEDNLIEEGVYSFGDSKGNVMDKGKYIAIWRKEDGDWKIYSNMFNTSLPPATK